MTVRSDIRDAGGAEAQPTVRRVAARDIVEALKRGVDDFRAIPTHHVLYGLVYAVVGLILVRVAFDAALLPLMFPIVAGFALVAPTVTVGLNELSRRREAGLTTRWWHLFRVRRHASFGPILALDAILAALFVLWLAASSALYGGVMGAPPADPAGFAARLFTTAEGWTLMVVWHVLGFLFALAAFLLTAVSFPLLVDRDAGLGGAILTSWRAVATNPGPMALWAAVLAGGLILGSLPLLLGLPVVLPILGHASWHVYRRVVPA